MKKLYRKAVVHPTPPLISDHLLYLLPTTLLTLTAALSSQERELLAYLISCSTSSSSSNNHSNKFKKTISTTVDHLPCFDCYCFGCYTSYWVKWDSSPNRELIHRIIDDFEDGLCKENGKEKGKSKKNKNRKNVNDNKGKGKSVVCVEKLKAVSVVELELDEIKKCEGLEDSSSSTSSGFGSVFAVGDEALEANNVEEEEEEMEKGPIRRFVSFVGERIWGVWG